MDGSTAYYLIKDLNKVGKLENFIPYIYDNGWIIDSKNILMDRIMGYDEYEPEDSPYKIGNTSMLDKVEVITEEEAKAILEKQLAQK